MAAEIRDPFDEDPMEAYFQEKLTSARQLAKNKRPRVDTVDSRNSHISL